MKLVDAKTEQIDRTTVRAYIVTEAAESMQQSLMGQGAEVPGVVPEDQKIRMIVEMLRGAKCGGGPAEADDGRERESAERYCALTSCRFQSAFPLVSAWPAPPTSSTASPGSFSRVLTKLRFGQVG